MASRIYNAKFAIVLKFSPFKDWILYEDDHFMVVNKPPMMSSLDERGDMQATNVLAEARKYCPQAMLCHRLDKETSGALMIAKDEATYRYVSMQLEHRRVIKTYHAVIEGAHRFDNLEVDLPIGKGRGGAMRVDFREGKDALTFFTSIDYFRHYTLVACVPITGRTHQIRVHLASQQAVIAGDTLYQGHQPLLSRIKRHYHFSKFEEEKPMINRFALHAKKLKLMIADDKMVEIEAPYPKDLEVFVKQLDKYDR